MPSALRTLPFVTPRQAIELIKLAANVDIDEEFLLSHCKGGTCKLYIYTDQQRGVSEDILTNDNLSGTTQCYATGKQLVLNPEILHYPLPDQANLRLFGSIRSCDDDSLFPNEEWRANIRLQPSPIIYDRNDIEELIKAFLATTPATTPDPRELNSACAIIAVLAHLAKIDLEKTNKSADLLRIHADSHGLPFPKSNATITKFFELAASLKPGAPSTPRGKKKP